MAQVSIITASYNYQDYIKETIESVISQTFQDWEMIIVDDGSKDNSVEVIKSYCAKDERIKLYTHENNQNKGLSETVKLGLQKANGEWVAFLESDDTITQTYLDEKFKIIEQFNNVDFIFNDVTLIGTDKSIAKMQSYFIKQKKRLSQIKFPANISSLFKQRTSNIIPTFSCVMCKKQILEHIDYDSPLKQCLDLYLWSQLAKDNNFYYLDKKLTNWRIHDDSYISTSRIDNYLKLLFELKRLYFLYNEVPLRKVINATFKYAKKSLLSKDGEGE